MKRVLETGFGLIILRIYIIYHLLVEIGPQRASDLNVQSLFMSSKYSPEGQRFRYG